MSSLREAAVTFFQTLDRLGIIYAVGGSLASSLHGIARATQDIDVVIDLHADQIKDLYQALAPQFYLDEGAMLGAVRQGNSCNVIHFESGLRRFQTGFKMSVGFFWYWTCHPDGSSLLPWSPLAARFLTGKYNLNSLLTSSSLRSNLHAYSR